MSRIIEARGPVVEALRRYDPGLRVRWSHERKRWAIDAPFNLPNPNVVPKPVRFHRIGNGDYWIETLLPEYSERNIQYRDKRHVICWAKRLNWGLLDAIVQRDSYRFKEGPVGLFDDYQAKQDAASKKAADRIRDDRIYAGWDRLKFNIRTNPNAEDFTGVSTKGIGRGTA